MENISARRKLVHIFQELSEHLPYSAFGVIISLMILGILNYFAVAFKAQGTLPQASENLFHIFHPIHMLLSATTTTAMFWKHERKVIKAFVVGFLGAVVVCGLSDILLPFLGGTLLGVKMKLHICILVHPQIVVPFTLVGILIGYLVPEAIEKSTQYSHSMHVLVSSMASVLYLITFGLTNWIHVVGAVFIITLVAVVLPCCLSDIVFPLTFVEEIER